VGVPAPGGFNQLVDDVLRGGLVGIAHAEIYNVLASDTGLLLELADNVKYIGRQALYSLKFVCHGKNQIEMERE
jgi:hypothetical protein